MDSNGEIFSEGAVFSQAITETRVVWGKHEYPL
jgi:hypothetical protein